MLKSLRHFITDTPTAGLHLAEMWPLTVCAGTMQQTSLFFHQLIKGHIMKIMEIHGLK